MAITIMVIFEDGTSGAIRDYDDVGAAVSAALDLADRHGRDPGDAHVRAASVQLLKQGRVELSVRVLRGGLLKPKVGQQ